MKSIVCTLFEGSYHKGAAALANSLYFHGWRGILVVGYRGALPPWAEGKLDSTQSLAFAPGASVQFRKLDTPIHFANYKPQFLKLLIKEAATPPDAIFYLDPDIVIKCGWEFFEEWVSYGVAMIEDVNSPIPVNHPRRAHWTRFFGERGIQLHHIHDMYVNSGFIGVNKDHFGICDMWERTMVLTGEALGGLEGGTEGGKKIMNPTPPTAMSPFNKMDQDALNAACMAAGIPVSIMAKQAMDFEPGGWTLSHAIGGEKPWSKHFLRKALEGSQPSLADKCFWQYSSGPIQFATPRERFVARWTLTAAAAIGRFYGRS